MQGNAFCKVLFFDLKLYYLLQLKRVDGKYFFYSYLFMFLKIIFCVLKKIIWINVQMHFSYRNIVKEEDLLQS